MGVLYCIWLAPFQSMKSWSVFCLLGKSPSYVKVVFIQVGQGYLYTKQHLDEIIYFNFPLMNVF